MRQNLDRVALTFIFCTDFFERDPLSGVLIPGAPGSGKTSPVDATQGAQGKKR
jgi:hypothetical protein